jgi:hypothetical protein
MAQLGRCWQLRKRATSEKRHAAVICSRRTQSPSGGDKTKGCVWQIGRCESRMQPGSTLVHEKCLWLYLQGGTRIPCGYSPPSRKIWSA